MIGSIPGLILATAFAAAAIGESPSREDPEVVVYAAISLRDVLTEIAPQCERETGARLVFNFAASGELARQILAARKADLFFSADDLWMDQLANAGLVEAGSRRSLLSNRLVVVAPAGLTGVAALSSPADLAGDWMKRLAIAEPRQVPAGRYAKQWLERAGLWDDVRDRVAPSLDARAALAAVESGAASAGIVYQTDAARSARARVIFSITGPDAPTITYPLAVLTSRPHGSLPRVVAEWFSGPQSRAAFLRAGFLLPGLSGK